MRGDFVMTAHTAQTVAHYFKDDAAYMPQPAAERPSFASLGHRLRHRVAIAWRRARELHALRQLSDRTLADIGLTRAELPLVFDPEFVKRFNAERTTRRAEMMRVPDAVELTQINEKRMGIAFLMRSFHI
jgi:uncharacterized protein YjiS (DUF1127 family)